MINLTFSTDMQNAVAARLEQLKHEIAQSISSHGLTASGRTAASMYVATEPSSVTLYGRPFFPALETGSSAWTGKTGVRCSYVEFKEIIRNWASAKGLNFGQHKAYEKAVGAIAMSIIRNGTAQTRRGRLDVYTSLVDKAVEDCSTLMADIANAEINNVIANWEEK